MFRVSHTKQMNNWKTLLENPFSDKGCGVPDDRTLLSGKIKTRNVSYFVPMALTGVPSVVHTGAIMIRPYPGELYTSCAQTTGNGTSITDLNVAGSAIPVWQPANGSTGFYSTDGSCMVRMVSCGVKVSYEGTELNRAGRYFAGLLPVTHQAFAPSGGGLSALSTLIPVDSSGGANLGTLKGALQCATTQRISDADFVVTWKPSGAPSYQRHGAANNLPAVLEGGGTLYESFFACNQGGAGNAYGDMCLIIVVENDYVGVPSGSGNLYAVTIDAHWEVVPDEQFGVVYPLTVSPYSAPHLASALNTIDRSTILYSRRSAPAQKKTNKLKRQPTIVAMTPRLRVVNTPVRVKSKPKSKPGFRIRDEL